MKLKKPGKKLNQPSRKSDVQTKSGEDLENQPTGTPFTEHLKTIRNNLERLKTTVNDSPRFFEYLGNKK